MWRSPTGHAYETPPHQVGPTPADRTLAAAGAVVGSWSSDETDAERRQRLSRAGFPF